jgi:hypothetical protein
MNRSARAPTEPIGRQGRPSSPGGQLIKGATATPGVINIGLIADDAVGAAEALGALPMAWGSIVIIWRCTAEEASRRAACGQLDCLAYCDSDDDGSLSLRYSVFRRSGLWKALDG